MPLQGNIVATLNTLHTGSLIDAAFLARPRSSARPMGRFAPPQEKAMTQRLHQLQRALGEKAEHPPEPLMAHAARSDVPEKRGHELSRTLLACLLSATLGAGAMWLAMLDQTDSLATRQQAGASIPPSAIVSPAAAAPSEAAALISNGIADETQIGNLVEDWRQAWRDQDIGAYLAAYGAAFAPADGSSRDAWVAARSKKLAGNAAIDIQVRDVAIERLAEDQFKVSFRQDYASGVYRESGRAKTLDVAREDGHWKIVREQQAP